MSRRRFGKLLQKYLRGDCTPAEKAFVEHWYGLLENDGDDTRENVDSTELENRLWNRIQGQIHADVTGLDGPSLDGPGLDGSGLASHSRVVPLRRWVRWGAVAASLLLIGGLYVGQYRRITHQSDVAVLPSQAGWVERTNATTKPLDVRLDDGSVVRLAPHSSLRFPARFAPDRRTVQLTGDAFFQIARMPDCPFLVYAGRVVTKVLGTSFFVRQGAAATGVQVDVVTGRVSVYEATSRKANVPEVVLTPNQTATFQEQNEQFVTGLVDRPRVIPAAEAAPPVSFRFNDTPLADVLTQLERAYGIQIEMTNDSQRTCPLTADLTGLPLYTQLDIICAALKSTYEVRGTTIQLTGDGCRE